MHTLQVHVVRMRGFGLRGGSVLVYGYNLGQRPGLVSPEGLSGAASG